jgi:hypothetical protein
MGRNPDVTAVLVLVAPLLGSPAGLSAHVLDARAVANSWIGVQNAHSSSPSSPIAVA